MWPHPGGQDLGWERARMGKSGLELMKPGRAVTILTCPHPWAPRALWLLSSDLLDSSIPNKF